MIKNISNLGDAALYCDFGQEVNKETNTKVIKYFKSIQEKNIQGINNLTPSYNKLIVSFDLQKTNFHNLKKEIENGKFREDLFHRLNVIPIHVPDLSSRKEDIALLCHFFLKRICKEQGIPTKEISNKALIELKKLFDLFKIYILNVII